jgi:rod shape determining protein RodA
VLAAAALATVASVLWILPSAGISVLRDYQVERLTGFLNPDLDPSGATYNVTQSITAVGSGGLDGRGVAGATQTNMNYLPEHATDFIFSSLAEQRGFLGAALLLLLYALVVWRGVKTITIAPSLFTAIVAAAVVATFVFQIFVNVGMTIGMAPITGIPLPFVSYGGSSMVASLVMIGLLQAIHVRGRLAGRP